MNWLAQLDQASFLGSHVWDFGFHSLFKEYGLLFFRRAMLRHPARTWKALFQYRRLVQSREDLLASYPRSLMIPDETTFQRRRQNPQAKPLIGLGFCLKPFDAARPAKSCPSGRANHDCAFLATGQPQTVCLECAIHTCSVWSWQAGCPVYVMTSAQDMAWDFLFPQLATGLFPSAILCLLAAYSEGYCRDYQEWRRADLGDKPERTCLSGEITGLIRSLLRDYPQNHSAPRRFRRRGNVFWPDSSHELGRDGFHSVPNFAFEPGKMGTEWNPSLPSSRPMSKE
jgi:hypothetical protein